MGHKGELHKLANVLLFDTKQDQQRNLMKEKN